MKKIKQIHTISSLKKDLIKLGVKPGMTIIVHSSLKSIGFVCGGPIAIIKALQQVLTKEGTLVMPAHSTHLSHPKDWHNPKVNQSLWEEIKKEMPPYEKLTTPTYNLGVIPELFRNLPEVERSSHPAYSFSAWGKEKHFILNRHSLNNGLGESSPLARLYDSNGYILLIGTDYDSNTSMHLSEHRVGVFPFVTEHSPVLVNGKKEWISYREIEYDESNFIKIGKVFEKKDIINNGIIGEASSKLINQKNIVDFTTNNILQYSYG